MSKQRILLVEDDVETARMLDLYFSARGYDLHPVHDGSAALAFCLDELPALIILDVRLPDMDGFELFRRLRATSRARYVPIVFLTQQGRRLERLEGLGLGADDYIAKPFDMEELYLRVHNVLSRDAREHVADPRTSLPAGALVERELARVAERPNRGALSVRLLNAEPFRDLYGVIAFAEVLRSVAILLHGLLDEFGGPDDFLGQESEEGFVVVSNADVIGRIAAEATRRFDADVQLHYSQAERSGDTVQVRSATGHLHDVTVMRLETSLLS